MTVARAISSPMPTSCRGRIRAASCRDLRSPQSTSEQLRRAYTPEVTSGGEFEPSIAHSERAKWSDFNRPMPLGGFRFRRNAGVWIQAEGTPGFRPERQRRQSPCARLLGSATRERLRVRGPPSEARPRSARARSRIPYWTSLVTFPLAGATGALPPRASSRLCPIRSFCRVRRNGRARGHARRRARRTPPPPPAVLSGARDSHSRKPVARWEEPMLGGLPAERKEGRVAATSSARRIVRARLTARFAMGETPLT